MSQTLQGGFSSRSAVDMGQFQKMSMGGGGGGGGGGSVYHHEDIRLGGYQGTRQQVVPMTRTLSRPDLETMSLRSMRLQTLPQQPSPVTTWMAQDGSEGSLISDRDAAFVRQPNYSSVNSYGSQMRQGGGSVSGTLVRGGGMAAGEGEMMVQTHSFKGPAYRTISRINNRNNRMSMGSMSGGSVSGGSVMQQQISSAGSAYGGEEFIMPSGSQSNMMIMQQRPTMSRAMSLKSVHSVGRGMDVVDGMDFTGSMSHLNG